VHDGTAERGFGCEFRIEVDRVFVARDFGESDHAFLRIGHFVTVFISCFDHGGPIFSWV
jgi:hypothetical protein